MIFRIDVSIVPPKKRRDVMKIYQQFPGRCESPVLEISKDAKLQSRSLVETTVVGSVCADSV